MARTFGGSNALKLASALAAAPPFTMACWLKPAAANGTIMSSSQTAGANRHVLQYNTGTVEANSTTNGTDIVRATTVATTPTGTWAHVGGVWASAASRTVYLNGGNAVTQSTSRSPSGIDNTSIGLIYGSGTTTFGLSGTIAEAAIWNIALSAADMALLALAISPLLIRPDALVAYWPMIGRTSPEIELCKGNGISLQSAPTQSDHCRIFYKRRSSRYSNLTISGTIGESLTGPDLSLAANEKISGTIAEIFTGPSLVLAGSETISGTAAETFAGPTLAATGSETIAGSIGETFTGPALAAAATETIAGTIGETLTGPALTAIGSETIAGSIGETFAGPGLALSATETIAGAVGQIFAGPALHIEASETIDGVVTCIIAVAFGGPALSLTATIDVSNAQPSQCALLSELATSGELDELMAIGELDEWYPTAELDESYPAADFDELVAVGTMSEFCCEDCQ